LDLSFFNISRLFSNYIGKPLTANGGAKVEKFTVRKKIIRNTKKAAL
jgi:hypothetical protein